MTTLAIALDALNKDSDRWSQVSTGLGATASTVDAITIPDGEFPRRGSLENSYANLRTKVTNLLVGARDEAGEIAAELIAVRSILQGADEAAKAAIESRWDFD